MDCSAMSISTTKNALEAHEALFKYGQYPHALTFASNDEMAASTDLEAAEPVYSAAFDATEGVKRHAACDECRKRKLKCSGELTGCARCLKQNLVCHFSEQKTMGRPRKKQRIMEEEAEKEKENTTPSEGEVVARRRRFAHITDPYDQAAFEALCPGPVTQYIKHNFPPPPPPFMTTGPIFEQRSNSLASEGTTPPSLGPTTPPCNFGHDPIYPTDVALWPDYSTMLNLPAVVQESHEHNPHDCTDQSHAHSHHHPTSTTTPLSTLTPLPSHPACPCLPNLYLTLSTLSTLSSFPVSSHTIETLHTAARTASAVLYCPVCPQRFQTGMQNVMLLGTLLTVLADGWHRVAKAKAADLARGFISSGGGGDAPLNHRQDLEWRTFAHSLIRTHVFGDAPSPLPPPSSCVNTLLHTPPSTFSLSALVEGMARRQRSWHDLEPMSGEFVARMTHSAEDNLSGMSLAQIHEAEGKDGDHLCLRIVEGARGVLAVLDRGPPTYRE